MSLGAAIRLVGLPYSVVHRAAVQYIIHQMAVLLLGVKGSSYVRVRNLVMHSAAY